MGVKIGNIAYKQFRAYRHHQQQRQHCPRPFAPQKPQSCGASACPQSKRRHSRQTERIKANRQSGAMVSTQAKQPDGQP